MAEELSLDLESEDGIVEDTVVVDKQPTMRTVVNDVTMPKRQNHHFTKRIQHSRNRSMNTKNIACKYFATTRGYYKGERCPFRHMPLGYAKQIVRTIYQPQNTDKSETQNIEIENHTNSQPTGRVIIDDTEEVRTQNSEIESQKSEHTTQSLPQSSHSVTQEDFLSSFSGSARPKEVSLHNVTHGQFKCKYMKMKF